MNEGIRLYSKIAVAPSNQVTNPDMVTQANLSVAQYGYTFSPELMSTLGTLGDTLFSHQFQTIIETLDEITGKGLPWKRLFNNFPYNTPDEIEYHELRAIAAAANQAGIRLGGNRLTALSCGHIIDSAVFDVDDFGACPICQREVPELSSNDGARIPFERLTPLKALGVSTDGFAKEASALIGRFSSMSNDEKNLVQQAIANNPSAIQYPETGVYRETLPLIYQNGGVESVRRVLSGATDVMRLAYSVSDANADLSLSSNVRFKLNAQHKRDFLSLLDGMKNAPEDMLRHRERWLRLGERLNPGTAKNRARFPNAYVAFDVLRNNPGSILTFNRKSEAGIRSHKIDVSLMKTRPGEFARKIDLMLRECDTTEVLTAFADIAPKLSDDLLHNLRKYFASRDLLPKRMFIPKGQANKAKIVDDNRAKIDPKILNNAHTIAEMELLQRYSQLAPLGKVYIDPMLRNVMMPFNRRADSSSTAGWITKGSRIPFSGDIIRGFVWWKNADSRVDVDLSAVMFDDNMNSLGHVAFTRLSDQGVFHSGDITDGGDGASEFIDFNINAMDKKTRYVALSVYSFTGQHFETFPCFCGFMERDAVGSGAVYEPESVAVRFDANNKMTHYQPIMFDLRDREVIFADMVLSKDGRYGAAIHDMDKQGVLTSAMLTLPKRKPTVFDVMYLNMIARGTQVFSPEEADVVFDLDRAKALIMGEVI